MRLRRMDDRTLGVLMATPTRWIADGTRAPAGEERAPRFALRSEPAAATVPVPCGDDGQDLVLQLEAGPEEGVLLTTAGTCRLPRAAEGDLLAQARAHVAELRQERMRQAKRQRLPDQLIAYFEELNAAEGEDAVFRALAVHALRIVGAHTSLALVLERDRGLLRAPARPGAPDEYRPCIQWDDRFAEPGVLLGLDTRGDGTCLAAAPLFGDPATAQVAHVPVPGEGVLVLTERREDRVFEPEDWDVMRALALQAEMALKRIRLIESVRSLSLTDSLTGLANRRHMDVVMEHAWSAARRGEALAVMVMDLDGFKAVNDAQGHQAGDRVLCQVADVLRSEARGSDVVVRFGGDEFLAILPGGNAAAAHALADRVRARLGGAVGMSAGVAVYRPELSTPDDLVREADRALYENKRTRGCR
jgi:diguanylate cyclase (GGDEF)-like protein